MNALEQNCQKELAALAEQGRLREFSPLDRGRERGVYISLAGSEALMLNLSSNDYLGLGGKDGLVEQFYQWCNESVAIEPTFGSTSSRLLAGDCQLAHQLEHDLAESYGKEAALLFNSGYHANIGILPALYSRRDLILSDKLNHASIVDGCRLSFATTKRYRHLDYDHLRWLLKKNRSGAERVVIVSESVFSMDGDVAELDELVRIRHQYNAELYIDEAHGFGLYGSQGLGKVEQAGLIGEVDFLVAVFGKAMASQGAFVACSEIIRRYLVNTARSLIFTTALPPIVIAWNLFLFHHVQQLSGEREKLAGLADHLRAELQRCGLRTGGTTNIVPVITGEDEITTTLAARLRKLGFFILPIRPPTVPAGTSRFRLSVTAGMSWQEICGLPAIIADELSVLREKR